MLKSMDSFHAELNSQVTEGIFTLFQQKREFNAARYLIGFGNIISQMNLSIKYIANNNITFTSEEIKKFIEDHPLEEVSEVQFSQANENTKSIKDYLLLSLYQAGNVLSHEKAFKIRDILLLKYIESCHPEILEHMEGVKKIYDDFLVEYNERIASVSGFSLNIV